MEKEMEKRICCEEILVPAPWGDIAVRIWGNQQNPPILMFHGLFDNVGCFTRLIPLLPTNHHYICVDLPGHGKSSHFPPKTTLNTFDYVLVYITITKHFKREKYTIIGHSYGGQLAYLFTQLYPERVEKLIMLDVLFFSPFKIEKMKNLLRKHHDLFFALSTKVREYDYEEALQVVATRRIVGNLSKDAAKPILDRVLVTQANGKVSLGHDPRIRFILNPLFSHETSLGFIQEHLVECPVLIVLSSESEKVHKRNLGLWDFFHARENVKVVQVEGNHDVHNIYPERVAPILNRFLLNKSNL